MLIARQQQKNHMLKKPYEQNLWHAQKEIKPLL